MGAVGVGEGRCRRLRDGARAVFTTTWLQNKVLNCFMVASLACLQQIVAPLMFCPISRPQTPLSHVLQSLAAMLKSGREEVQTFAFTPDPSTVHVSPDSSDCLPLPGTRSHILLRESSHEQLKVLRNSCAAPRKPGWLSRATAVSERSSLPQKLHPCPPTHPPRHCNRYG